jgi:PAS domain S-box-containing protein
MESLKALFEYATEGIVISDNSGKIVKINPSAEKLFGYDNGELINQKIEILVPNRFNQSHEKHRNSFYQNPHPRAMGKGVDLFGKKKNGEELPVEISLSHYKVEDEQFVICFIIDVSERKLTEEKITQMNSNLELKVEERTKILKETMYQLEISKQELSTALEKEKELNEMKSRFVTMASHEFRTPLSTILSSASLIGKYKKEEEDEKREKHVNRIKSAVSNMTLILNDFLSAGKLEEGKISVNRVNLNIPLSINESINELSNFLKKGQSILYKHEGLEEFDCDPQFIKNIIINLVSNASKFSSENKTIDIKSITSHSDLKIIVKDNGIGIPLEEQKNLFQRFFRAKNVLNIEGTGLGLNIVAKYIEILNGTITFNSELNKGTTFNITIPLINENNLIN